MRNFRPFDGDCEVDLAPVEGNPMVLVFGENMSGKTGIFLALKWCLYGRAVGRRGEPIPVFAPGENENNFLINANAIERGDYETRVSIAFDHDGQLWQLTRSAQCAGDPTAGDPFVEETTLQIGDGVKSKHSINEEVNRVLHLEASQFYLFDGELLSEYERWLEDPEQRETRVRLAIERTVGTSALRLYEELDRVARDSESEQQKLLRKEKREEKLIGDLTAKQERLLEVEGELEQYQAEVAKLEVEAKRIEEKHGELAAFAKDQGRLQEIERAVDDAKEQQRDAEAAIREIVRSKYWLAAGLVVEDTRAELSLMLEAAVSGPEDSVRLRLLEASLEAGECELCETEIAGPTKGRMEVKQQYLTLGSAVAAEVDDVVAVVERMRECNQFATDGQMDALEAHEDVRLDARSRAHSLSDEADRIREVNSGRARGDREREMARLRQILDDIGETRETKAEAETEQKTLIDDIQALQAKVNRIEIDPLVQRHALAARLATNVFKRALEPFREEARSSVEAAASAVFRQLVKEEEYDALRIDEDYRIVPTDADGSVLPIPSAGGQQLVTLALIGGLNASAVHSAPIVMDTPAGRIDKPNRERILRWVRGLDQQVILMVHSGEFTPEEVETMGIDAGRAYRIRRSGFQTSEIIPLGWEET